MNQYESKFIFLGVVCLCLCNAFSCTTHRTAKVRTNMVAVDTIRTSSTTDTTRAVDVRHERQHTDLTQRVEGAGSLTITRDTCGRPIAYHWRTSTDLRAGGVSNFDGVHLALGSSSTTAKDSTYILEEVKDEEQTTTAKSGVPLEKYIGGGVMLFVIAYLIFIAIEKWILKR